jgi:hypothetical protein
MKDLQASSLAELAKPLRGLSVLLYGFSSSGFPSGDGAREAVRVLPPAGVLATYTHAEDRELGDKLSAKYDVAIITNTRTPELAVSDPRLWSCSSSRAWLYWDLRSALHKTRGAAALAGKIDRVFLPHNGPWTDPTGTLHDPADWGRVLGCPVSYCPQGAPLRDSVRGKRVARVVFVGDLLNPRYHAARQTICRELRAKVINSRERQVRLSVEAKLPEIYGSSVYSLSLSPLAPGYTSIRTYSILACGGLLVLQRFPGCERLFRDGEHAILFDTVGELKERLAGLDGDEAERRRIADNGRRLHAERHTVAHRVLSICAETVGVSREFSGWL